VLSECKAGTASHYSLGLELSIGLENAVFKHRADPGPEGVEAVPAEPHGSAGLEGPSAEEVALSQTVHALESLRDGFGIVIPESDSRSREGHDLQQGEEIPFARVLAVAEQGQVRIDGPRYENRLELCSRDTFNLRKLIAKGYENGLALAGGHDEEQERDLLRLLHRKQLGE
jgi:hypothetical protein